MLFLTQPNKAIYKVFLVIFFCAYPLESVPASTSPAPQAEALENTGNTSLRRTDPPTIIPLIDKLKDENFPRQSSIYLPGIEPENPPAKSQLFLREELIPKEGLYFSTDFGLDARSGMPYDHVRIRPKKGILGEIGNYTAASKLSLSIPFLLNVARRKNAYQAVKMTPQEARALLEKSLDTLLTYIKEYPEYGGFLPWVDIRPNGKIAPANTKIPSLDNGQMTWALAAVVSVWEDSKKETEKRIAGKAKKILASQNYSKFLDPETGMLFGTIQKAMSSEEWKGDKSYMLNDMFEGTMAVLWGVLNGQISEDTWYNLAIPTADYRTQAGETITTFEGFRASFHEHWGVGFLPLMESPLAPLYYNHLYVQADFARKNGIPGFLSTAYDPRGTYRQMGVPEISANPVDRSDVAVVFATAMGILIDPASGSAWLENLYRFGDLVSKFGAVESVGPDGYADIFTADAKGMTLLSAGGGLSREIKHYLMTHSVPRTGISMYAKWIELTQGKYLQMLSARKGKRVRNPSHPIPAPPEPSKTMTPRKIELFDPGQSYNISAHLQKGHLHGKNCWSVGHKTLEDDAGPNKNFQFEFEIPPYFPYFDQWAFRGTYVDKAAKISGMNYIRIAIPRLADPALYEIELKSDDVTLTTSVIDTTESGAFSPDGKWKYLYHKINVIPEADEKPFNYFSVAIHDPRYLAGDFALYGRRGTVKIKDIELLKSAPEGVKVEKSSKATLADSSELIQYWRPSHGTLPFKRSFGETQYQFSSGLGWRGGYMPYTDMSQFKFLRIKARSLQADGCNCFNIEIKHEDTLLLNFKVPVKLPPSEDWTTIEIKIPENLRDPLNYFAISDPIGEFEMSSISLSNEPLPEKPGIMKIQEITKKLARCEYRCSV